MSLQPKYYAPTDTYERFDSETDTWYNGYGQELRDTNDYDNNQEGHTPFGDE